MENKEEYMIQKLTTCHDCGVKPGENHKPGCDWERCPFCYGQLIGCDCCYIFFGIDTDTMKEKYPEVFFNGLPKALEKIWDWVLHKKGLLPYKTNPLEKAIDTAPEGKINEIWEKQIMRHHNDVEEFREKLFHI